ncbi:MAG: hypothetical protein ACRC7N_00430 [Clostridium sp.]
MKSSNIIKNKFPDEALPSDGKILNHFIEDGKIKGINGQRRVDFVINKDGNLVLGKKHQLLGNADDVMAAGQLKIDGKGMIRRIDNGSGHYRPTVEEALKYPELFKNAGLNLDKAWINIDKYTISDEGIIINSKNVVNRKLK